MLRLALPDSGDQAVGGPVSQGGQHRHVSGRREASRSAYRGEEVRPDWTSRRRLSFLPLYARRLHVCLCLQSHFAMHIGEEGQTGQVPAQHQPAMQVHEQKKEQGQQQEQVRILAPAEAHHWPLHAH